MGLLLKIRIVLIRKIKEENYIHTQNIFFSYTFICGFIYQSVSDCSLFLHIYVHTSLNNIKGIHLYYLDCSTVIYLMFHFISL